jgi:hypothetical protein
MFTNVFNEQKLDNGDIILIRRNIPIKDYSYQIYSNGDILLTKTKTIIIDHINISEYNFNDSFIMDVSLNNVEILDTRIFRNYKLLLNHLTNENVNDNHSHNTYVDYIISHCQENNISLNMRIRLNTKDVAIIMN